ncbi:GHKL domain-containing protein [Granulicatella sp. 19428wC4_WM01]|nr:GHKL domain-containing protein [Granulicatella sp. 19428wC4_WM01]
MTGIMWVLFILFKSIDMFLYISLLLTGIALANTVSQKEIKKREQYLHTVLSMVDALIDEPNYKYCDSKSDLLEQKINYLARTLNEKTTRIFQQHTQLHTLMEHLPVGIMVLNAQKKVVLSNQSLKVFLGDIFEMIYLEYFKLDMIRSSSLVQLIEKAYSTKETQKSPVYVYESTELSVDAHVIPLLNTYQQVDDVLVILYDLTEYRRLQIAQSDFVSNASHELKTPVSIIKGFVETLMDGAKDDEDAREKFLAIIYQETEKLEQLMKDILLLSKLEKKAMLMTKEVVHVQRIIHESIALVQDEAQDKHICIDTDISDESVWIIGDKHHLMQIISNILSNAVRYTKQDGYIRICVCEQNDTVQISIKDTGIGISLKDKERIFERFYRGDNAQKFNEQGTGLGLSIVKNLVDTIGAELIVDSQLGFGTKMTLVIKK